MGRRRSPAEPLSARPGRELLVTPAWLAPLSPASRLEFPPAPGPLELQNMADRPNGVVGEAVFREHDPNLARVLQLGGSAADSRRQRSGIFQAHELDCRPDG